MFVPSSTFPPNVTTWKANDIFQSGIIQDIVSSYALTVFWVFCYPKSRPSAQETTPFSKINMPVCLICNQWRLVMLIFYCGSLWICWLGCDFHCETVLVLFRYTLYWWIVQVYAFPQDGPNLVLADATAIKVKKNFELESSGLTHRLLLGSYISKDTICKTSSWICLHFNLWSQYYRVWRWRMEKIQKNLRTSLLWGAYRFLTYLLIL